MTRKPTFIIGGAPKCGTTALANYLREHPEVFFSSLKEPFYFASDLPNMRKSVRIETESNYLRLFHGATEKHLAIGEGSSLYLMSENAIGECLSFNPQMKFIFMLRRPWEIAHAFHMQARLHEYEDIDDFEAAWGLQDARLVDQSMVPERCLEPRLLQYRQVAAIGTQLEKAMKIIPSDQLHTILFDDFIKSPRSAYVKACSFIRVKDNNKNVFQQENASRESRFRLLTRLMRSRPVVAFSQFSKNYLHGNAFDLTRSIKHSLMFKPSARKTLNDQFEAYLRGHFLTEVELLENLLKRNLTFWKHNHRSNSDDRERVNG